MDLAQGCGVCRWVWDFLFRGCASSPDPWLTQDRMPAGSCISLLTRRNTASLVARATRRRRTTSKPCTQVSAWDSCHGHDVRKLRLLAEYERLHCKNTDPCWRAILAPRPRRLACPHAQHDPTSWETRRATRANRNQSRQSRSMSPWSASWESGLNFHARHVPRAVPCTNVRV